MDAMSTITRAQRSAISKYLKTHDLPVGLGTPEAACSIAAINLALTGELTDRIPDCMSEVIGRWIIVTQDEMPTALRNSLEWKRLLPLAAGTGREKESERLALALEWMWTPVLPSLQSVADRLGFGTSWNEMCVTRTAEAAEEAARAAEEAARATAGAAEAAEEAAWAAAGGQAAATWAAAGAALAAARAAGATAGATAEAAARAAAEAAWAAARAAGATAGAAWEIFDPCGLLKRMIDV